MDECKRTTRVMVRRQLSMIVPRQWNNSCLSRVGRGFCSFFQQLKMFQWKIFQRTLIVIGSPLVGLRKSVTWASLVEPDVNFICCVINLLTKWREERLSQNLALNLHPCFKAHLHPPCLIWTLTWLLCKYGITLSHLPALHRKTSTRLRQVFSYDGDRATTG